MRCDVIGVGIVRAVVGSNLVRFVVRTATVIFVAVDSREETIRIYRELLLLVSLVARKPFEVAAYPCKTRL